MTVAAVSKTTPLMSAEQLERCIEEAMPVDVLEAQLEAIASHPQRRDTDSLCELMAVLDQQHRLKRLAPEDFRRLKSRIAPLIVSGTHPGMALSREAAAPVPVASQPARPQIEADEGDLEDDNRDEQDDDEPAPPPQARVIPKLRSVDRPAAPAPPPSSPPRPQLRVQPAAPVAAVVPAPPTTSVPLESPTPAIAPGRVLRARYELRRLLGEGGMSCVFEAVDRRREGAINAEPRVAVKVLRPSLAARPDAVQALRLEFERAQALSHPGIVNVFDLDADGDVHFITMERLEGELLSSVIKRLRPGMLRRDQSLAILSRLGEAIAFAHDAGIVHADIKPGNVMLTSGGELRLFDFGAAWPAQREPWIYDGGERSLQGATPTYASAERLGGAAPTVRDDVYSFCCVAYELLAGVHPFDRHPANEAQRLRLRAKRPRGLARHQWRALARGLAFRREDRWPDMDSLLGRLDLPPARGPLPLVLDAEPPARAVGLSGVTMLLLGAGAFAVAHFYGGAIEPTLTLLLDGVRSLFR